MSIGQTTKTVFSILGIATTFCYAYSDMGNTACKGCEVSFSTTDISPQMHAITGCVNLQIMDILNSKVQIHFNMMEGDVMCCKLP